MTTTTRNAKTGFATMKDEQGKVLAIVTTAKRFGLDATGGIWVAICTTHSTVCNFETNDDAFAHMPLRDWCEACDREEASTA